MLQNKSIEYSIMDEKSNRSDHRERVQAGVKIF